MSKDASLDNFVAERAGLEVSSLFLSVSLMLSAVARTYYCGPLFVFFNDNV